MVACSTYVAVHSWRGSLPQFEGPLLLGDPHSSPKHPTMRGHTPTAVAMTTQRRLPLDLETGLGQVQREGHWRENGESWGDMGRI